MKGKDHMAGNTVSVGKWHKLGLATLGAMTLAAPLVAALANPALDAAAPAPDAAAAAQPEPLSAAQVAQGRSLFNSWSCSACHVLTDANAHGHIGPSLDGNANLDHAFVVSRITNGQGAMPGFGGQLSPEEIDLLAAYIVQVKQ